MAMNQLNNAQSTPSTPSDPRWTAVVTRDPKMDGVFFYGVTSTGVYCRPSCPARTPLPENIRFFPSTTSAELAGFRPCRRCQPNQPPAAQRQAALIAKLCLFIDNANTPPTLEQLANQAGLSISCVHRLFKSVTGLTPKAYANARRTQQVQAALASGKSVTEAVYSAGYNTSARFYEHSSSVLGMQPKQYRNGGYSAEIQFAIGQCSLGSILVARSVLGVCAIFLGDNPAALVNDLHARFPKAQLIGSNTGFEQWLAQVINLVEAPGLGHDLPLDIRGTAFQQRVWQALRDIPPGATASYSQIARQIGHPKAVRAVAGACAANTLAVAIPCHRVLGSDGRLSGYRWGVARKMALLKKESES